MHWPPTVAVFRTDRQPLLRGQFRPALREFRARLLAAVPAAPRASARVRTSACLLGAFGRWRCRWTTRLLVVAAAGIGRLASHCRPSRVACSCPRFFAERELRAAARRRVTIASRRGYMR
jgi:hypothetical protein